MKYILCLLGLHKWVITGYRLTGEYEQKILHCSRECCGKTKNSKWVKK